MLTARQKGRLAGLIGQYLRSNGVFSVEEAAIKFADFADKTRAQQKSFLLGLINDKKTSNTTAISELSTVVQEKEDQLIVDNGELTDMDVEVNKF